MTLSNPLRELAEADVRAELARVGVEALDKNTIIRRYAGLGASRTRARAWVDGEIARAGKPAGKPVGAKASAEPIAPAPPAGGGVPSIVPDSAKGVLEHLTMVMETSTRVLNASHDASGKVRNSKLALASAEQLRRCLETALKIYESINNVQQVERFMACVIEELRLLEPEAARAVVDRMRATKGRWA